MQLLTLCKDLFEAKPAEFSSMFRRILSMLLDRTLSATVRTHLVCFLIHAFQSLDSDIVRKECAPLVSIGIWHNIYSDNAREKLLDQAPQLRKAWRAASKRYEAGDDAAKAKLRFERSWLYTLLLDFLNLLYSESGKQGKHRWPSRYKHV
jgi:intron-binding protein aquarius